MVRHLPPLPALRAFEAAARHLSFVRAGSELGVTPGAVSHQMKKLERWVDGALFERQTNGVRLTETGRVFAARLGAIFDQITATSLAARSPTGGTAVIVRSQFSLAAKWLAPLLGRFRAIHPDIAVVLHALQHRWNLGEPDADLAIYHARDAIQGIHQETLIAGRLIAVGAPRLIAALPETPTPVDLLSQPLIHVHFAEPVWHDEGWEAWFAATGFTRLVVPSGLGFNLTHLAIEACLAGAGFALVPDFLVAQELADGRLIDPFGISVPIHQPYVIMTPEIELMRPEVVLLRNWLLAEGRAADKATAL
ncbi:LysR family transcriptional regulator, glycine cleavage system transcriptional activator [Rhizobiales bacterium GAS113]|jgi:LysR family glycine cleavage system transcriptional activator|nr:LysR family transcriptional regulator, glycine cleavage system transcriptional activator [Rhizobiales bacterium GAS113]SEB77062.1 LysR family transcriptional regulator, glycine cleavage system transcriptional activator [Rhizobiales bacterium GAS188]